MPPRKKAESTPAVKPTPRAAAKKGGAGLGFDERSGPGGPGGTVDEKPRPRPGSLDEVEGHAEVKRAVRAAMASGRMHHAWVFAGEQGVGKYTAALAVAAELLLPAAGHPERARLESLLRAGNHPDVHIVTKELASVSRKPQVRDSKQTTIAKDVLDEFLIEPAQKTCAVNAGSIAGKVFVVDEAELIDETGQNALLKTLEEPSPGTVIILVTSREARLLATIRSRCQRAAFFPLSDAQVERALERAGVEVPPAQRAWVLKYARGAPGAAATALQEGLFAWQQDLGPLIGAALRREPAKCVMLGPTMAKHVTARAKAEVEGVKQASKESANRLWARRMLAFVAEACREALKGEEGGGPGSEDAAAVRAQALRGIDLCGEAQGQIESNVGFAMVLENLGAQMATGGRGGATGG